MALGMSDFIKDFASSLLADLLVKPHSATGAGGVGAVATSIVGKLATFLGGILSKEDEGAFWTVWAEMEDPDDRILMDWMTTLSPRQRRVIRMIVAATCNKVSLDQAKKNLVRFAKLTDVERKVVAENLQLVVDQTPWDQVKSKAMDFTGIAIPFLKKAVQAIAKAGKDVGKEIAKLAKDAAEQAKEFDQATAAAILGTPEQQAARQKKIDDMKKFY